VIGPGIGARITVAIVAAAAVVASLAVSPDLRGWAGAGLALLMLAIAACDARSFRIPDALSASAVALGLVHAGLDRPHDLMSAVAMALLRGLVLAGLFLALRALYGALRGREGLGLGDVKLAGAAGVWLDWWVMPIAIEIGALAALALYVAGHVLGRRRIQATTRLPFGLFLAPAIWIAWLMQAWLGGI
jgi:leader peptidase (prepilin peptidase)/N-methyltransferase